MGGEDEDYSYDYWVDEVFKRHGDEFIAERADEIAEDVQKSGLFDSIIGEHRSATTRADELLKKAQQRFDEGEYEEAVFAAGRALEGYCTAVFINTLFDVLTKSFSDALPHVKIKATDLFGDSLRAKHRFIHFGLLAFADAKDAGEIAKRLAAYISAANTEGGWRVRNRVFHTFIAIDKEAAEKAIARASDMLNIIRAPIQKRVAEMDAEAAKRRAEREKQSPWWKDVMDS